MQNGIPLKGQHQYFLKVVPTTYSASNDGPIETNQFSVTEHFKPSPPTMQELPGLFFFYDLSPIKVFLLLSAGHGCSKLTKFVVTLTAHFSSPLRSRLSSTGRPSSHFLRAHALLWAGSSPSAGLWMRRSTTAKECSGRNLKWENSSESTKTVGEPGATHRYVGLEKPKAFLSSCRVCCPEHFCCWNG